jgi:4-hydroxy-tetrahydrodipicolinate synthase
METVRKFHGIIPPLVTPLSDRDALDEYALQRLIEHVIAGGVRGVFILGTTGEGPSLSYRLRREMITQTCEITAERVPVFVGVTDTAFAESIDLSLIAADAGADAVVVAPPYYLPTSQAELAGYVERLAAELPLPMFLYNMPRLTKVWFDVETVRRLASLTNILGVKDSSGDLDYFTRLVTLRNQHRPDWSLLVGPEHLLVETLERGGDGGVNGGANVFPELFVGCYDAWIAADTTRAATLRNQIDDFQQLYAVGQETSRFIKATKCALSLLDICDDQMAEPFERFGPREREAIRRVVETTRFSLASHR